MLDGRRPVPLDIAEKLDLKFSENMFMVSGSNVPMKIPKKLDGDLAYLVGVLRDGTVAREGNNEYLCAFYNKDKEFVEIVRKVAEKTFYVKTKIEKMDEVWGIRMRSLNLYLFFTLLFEIPKKQEFWKTPEIIETADKELQREYVSGFWDAEGTCSRIEKFSKISSKNTYIGFNQKNKESLLFIKDVLEKENIRTGDVYWNGHVWVLKIATGSITRFARYMKSKHPKKSKRLVKIGNIFSSN
ncbi:MAG: hypothetical protein HZB67_03640 [Candidatus Aenigmarchaeota archaeon]|nr:hypothetical protein [Candidatus Aenigmarchaeota archaeon]